MALATEMGGSIAARHGLGRATIVLVDRNGGPVERILSAGLKQAMDPRCKKNLGAIIADPSGK
ncbi:hypothetical protein M2281_002825 [Mesorhizobium soli]|uniref:FAD-linked oxidase C-terminal domain-containing protein n=1 Tax=Pseudaminobacter soli (ex Li et al. 2025) TaxID=1295366 RepID=UPI002475286F|nr:FAD-linked oxidase C-terminal domain-containing protein [Mesorhizobium soli]MDH6232227.1 hypothetical protein [Mesorhizobium soli]